MQRHWTYQLAVISCVFWLDFFMLFVNCNLLRIKSGISCHLSLRQDTKGWVHWAVWKSGWRPDHSKYSTCTDLVWWQSNSIKEVWQSKYPTAASSWTWKKNMTHQHQTTLNLSGCITPISTAMVQKIQWNSQTAWNKTPIDPKFSSSDNQSNENSNKKNNEKIVMSKLLKEPLADSCKASIKAKAIPQISSRMLTRIALLRTAEGMICRSVFSPVFEDFQAKVTVT